MNLILGLFAFAHIVPFIHSFIKLHLYLLNIFSFGNVRWSESLTEFLCRGKTEIGHYYTDIVMFIELMFTHFNGRSLLRR